MLSKLTHSTGIAKLIETNQSFNPDFFHDNKYMCYIRLQYIIEKTAQVLCHHNEHIKYIQKYSNKIFNTLN